MKKNSVILIGFMGSGKTTVGRILADLLHVPFFDSDTEIEQRTGSTITEIFEQLGEPAFRTLEYQVLQELLCQTAVLSTGGGIIVSQENREVLTNCQTVVYLKTSPTIFLKRLADDQNRPLVQGKSSIDIQAIFEKRADWYEAVADMVVQTDFLTPIEVARKIQTMLVAKY